MWRIRKTFKFETSHQLSTAYSHACTDTIHGHSYVCEVFLTSKKLNADGMVLDFGQLKHEIGFIFDHWDHALILPEGKFSADELDILRKTQKKLLITKYNPTAECMSESLLKVITKLLMNKKAWRHICVEKVRVHETATGWAEYQK